MKVTLKASTGAKILIWREDEIYHARRAAPDEHETQRCLAVDLFEVIAELAGLSLEEGAQAAEAMDLAETAQRRLASARSQRPDDPEDLEDLEDGTNASAG